MDFGITELPTELKYNIIERFTPEELVNMCQTNREFNLICRDKNIWNHFINKRFPGAPIFCDDSYKTYQILDRYDKAVILRKEVEGQDYIEGVYFNEATAIDKIISDLIGEIGYVSKYGMAQYSGNLIDYLYEHHKIPDSEEGKEYYEDLKATIEADLVDYDYFEINDYTYKMDPISMIYE